MYPPGLCLHYDVVFIMCMCNIEARSKAYRLTLDGVCARAQPGQIKDPLEAGMSISH